MTGRGALRQPVGEGDLDIHNSFVCLSLPDRLGEALHQRLQVAIAAFLQTGVAGIGSEKLPRPAGGICPWPATPRRRLPASLT